MIYSGYTPNIEIPETHRYFIDFDQAAVNTNIYDKDPRSVSIIKEVLDLKERLEVEYPDKTIVIEPLQIKIINKI
ncbi:hypothetical protein [Leptolyngbya phage Lbo-JY46]